MKLARAGKPDKVGMYLLIGLFIGRTLYGCGKRSSGQVEYYPGASKECYLIAINDSLYEEFAIRKYFGDSIYYGVYMHSSGWQLQGMKKYGVAVKKESGPGFETFVDTDGSVFTIRLEKNEARWAVVKEWNHKPENLQDAFIFIDTMRRVTDQERHAVAVRALARRPKPRPAYKFRF